jgi:Ca-activated chloride channel family protein
MLLRDSPHKGSATMSQVLDLAGSGHGTDRDGYRGEFMELAQSAGTLLAQREMAGR